MKQRTRFLQRFALLLAALVAVLSPGLARADYVAGWDFKGLAQAQWSTSTGTAIALEGAAPHTWTSMPEHTRVFSVDFTVDALPEAAGAIASWKMANSTEIVFGKTATTDGTATLYLGWGYWEGGKASNNYTTYLSTAGHYTSWTADASSHTFRIEYDHEDTTGKIRGTRVFMDGVKICDVSGLRFKDVDVTALVLGGCSGSKGQERWPNSTATFSNVTYSSGTPLSDSATLTSNGYTLNLNGCVLNSDGSVSIVGTGLSVVFAEGDDFYNTKRITAVVEVANVPSSGTILDYNLGNACHLGLSVTASSGTARTLNQSWLNNNSGTAWYSTGYNSASHATAGDSTFSSIALAYRYVSGSDRGAQTFFDGASGIAEHTGIFSSNQGLRGMYVGALRGSNDLARGMRIRSIKLYTTNLDASGAAAAMDDMIIRDGESLSATKDCRAAFCGEYSSGVSLDLAGHTVSLIGSYSGSGTVTVSDSGEGGSTTLDIGMSRPAIGGLASGATLAVSRAVSVSDRITGYAPTAELTVTGDLEGTVTLNGEEVEPVVEDGTATLTGTVVAANPTYTGSAWWWDYEFNGTVTSIGSDTGGMDQEGSGTSFYNNTELYFQKTPYRSASFSSKSELTAVMYCQPGNYANKVLVGFGSTTATGQKAIALVTGADPSSGEMKLVLTEGSTLTTLANLTAVGATTTKHLYAFVMDRITEDATTKTRVRVYLDGKVKAIYKHNGTLTLSDGFQIGSLHGGVVGGVGKYPATGDSGTLDFLRVIDGTLTDAAMSALAEAYPYHSEFGTATRDPVSASANWVSDGAWTQTLPGQGNSTQDAPNTNTNVTLSKDGSSDVSVAINLAEDTAYESLTLTKEAGATGSLKLTSDFLNPTSGKLVSAETSVLVNATIPAGRARLGITSVGDGVSLTVDPVNTTINGVMSGLAFGGVYEDTVISMALLGDGASVALDSAGVSTLATYGFTAELIHNPSNLSYTFRLTREVATANIAVDVSSGGVVTWSTRGIAVPAPESLPNTYAGNISISSESESSVTIATAIAGGNLTAASGDVTLSGALTTSGTVTVSDGATLRLTANASSAITVASGGTLVTDGDVTLSSGSNTIAGTLEVASGTTVLSGAECGLTGTLKIDSGATVQCGVGDLPDWNGSPTLDIAGTLELTGSTRWSLPSASTTTLRDGAILKGTGDGTYAYGFDFFDGGTVTTYGTVDVQANIGAHGEGTKVIDFAFQDGGVVTLSGDIGGNAQIKKNGTNNSRLKVAGTASSTKGFDLNVGFMRFVGGCDIPAGATISTSTTGVAFELDSTEADLTLPCTLTPGGNRTDCYGSGSHVTTLSGTATFSNALNVKSGTVRLTGTPSISGTVVVSADAKLALAANLTVTNLAAAAISGAGEVEVESGKTLTISVTDGTKDYSSWPVTGSGTIAFNSTNWIMLPTSIPSTLAVENNLTAGLILKQLGVTYTIGSLSGSGSFRVDWGGDGTNPRSLTVHQNAASTYSGNFLTNDAPERFGTFTVTGDAETAVADKLLTLSGETTIAKPLVVDANGAVALSGSWAGNVTLNGYFSGVGTPAIGGNMTLGSGTLDVTDGSPSVAGTVTQTAETSLTVVMPALFSPTTAGSKVIAASSHGLKTGTVLQATVKAGSTTLDNAVLVAKADGLYVVKPTVPDVPEGSGVTEEQATALAETLAKAAAAAGVAEISSYKNVENATDNFSADRAIIFPESLAVSAEGEASTAKPTFGIKSLTVKNVSGTNYVIIQAEAHNLADGGDIVLGPGLEEVAAETAASVKTELAEYISEKTSSAEGVTTKWFVLDLPGSTTSYGVKATK